MGTYTTNLKFYKPDPTEFVDVDVQLNANWDITDKAFRQLLEYEYTVAATPDVTNAVNRARFYKEYSNAFVAYFKSGNFFYQDPSAFVSTWIPAAGLLQSGWVEHEEMPMYYRIVRRAPGQVAEVEWCGAFKQPTNVLIDANTNMTFIDIGGIPTDIRPANNRYFDTSAGNTATDFSIARVLIGSDGRGEFKRYGANPASPGLENRIELNGIRYPLEAQ